MASLSLAGSGLRRLWRPRLHLVLLAGCALLSRRSSARQAGPELTLDAGERPKKTIKAPELDGGTAWLNTAGPLTLEGPQGQGRPPRLLDALLHQLHPHACPTWPSSRRSTPTSSSSSASTRRSSTTRRTPRASARRSCATRSSTRSSTTPTTKIWDATASTSWPTLVLIDPEGNFVGQASGEGQLRRARPGHRQAGQGAPRRRRRSTKKPIHFDLAKESDDTPAVLPRQGARRRGAQAPVHRRQHAPPHRRHRPRRQEDRRRRHRRPQASRTARSTRPSSTTRRAWPSTATRSTSPTARTTASARST